MRETLLILAVLFVPLAWGYAMHWLMSRLWRQAAAPPADRLSRGGASSANLPDYQI